MVRIWRALQGQGGQSLVETALAVPMLAALLLGTAEGARALHTTVILQGAVQAGAQYGSLSPANSQDSAGIDAAVRAEMLVPQASATNPVVSASRTTDANGESRLTVSGTFTLNALFAFPGLPSVFSITRSATVQVQR